MHFPCFSRVVETRGEVRKKRKNVLKNYIFSNININLYLRAKSNFHPRCPQPVVVELCTFLAQRHNYRTT